LQPDVILLDNHLPGVNGVDALPGLREVAPGQGADADRQRRRKPTSGRGAARGASGYLLKTADSDVLASAIERAMQGESTISPEMTGKLVTAFQALQRRRRRPTGGAGRPGAQPVAARARDPGRDRPRRQQQGNRAHAGHRRSHGEDPRAAHPAQAQSELARAGRGVCDGASTSAVRAGSSSASTRRTPWPMRRAPRRPASSTRSATSASPACRVSARPASCTHLQRAGVLRRRVAVFGAGQVKAHHALALVADGQARGALGFFGRQVAHGADDQAALLQQGQRAARQAGQQRFHRRFAGHAVGFKQQRRDAEFSQHGAVGGGVFGRFKGHALHGGRAGHGLHRQRKTFQVLHQAAGVGVGVKPGGQRGFVGRRCRHATFAQQGQQGGHPQATVQVFMQQDLGQGAGARLGGGAVKGGGHRAMLVRPALAVRPAGLGGAGPQRRRCDPVRAQGVDVSNFTPMCAAFAYPGSGRPMAGR
jgi:hypothetical protein